MSREYPCVYYYGDGMCRCGGEDPAIICVMGPCPNETPSNADRIRAMSDEELAEFLCDFRACDADEHPCNGCKAEKYCRAGHTGTIDWLKQPAEEDT